MPRFFDDYSDTYLTHDSSAGRKQQRRGWKFRENFRRHYEKHLDEWRSGPMGLASAQQGFLRQRPPGDPSIPPLPEGWTEEADESTHISFYTHKESGKRSWVRPGFFPPPAGGPPPPSGFHQGNIRGPPPPSFGNHQRGPPPPNFSQPPPNFSHPPPNFNQPPPPPPTHFQGPPPPFTNLPPPPPTGR